MIALSPPPMAAIFLRGVGRGDGSARDRVRFEFVELENDADSLSAPSRAAVASGDGGRAGDDSSVAATAVEGSEACAVKERRCGLGEAGLAPYAASLGRSHPPPLASRDEADRISRGPIMRRRVDPTAAAAEGRYAIGEVAGAASSSGGCDCGGQSEGSNEASRVESSSIDVSSTANDVSTLCASGD